MRAAERRIGRDLVKAAIARAQQRARNAEITPGQVADAAAAELPGDRRLADPGHQRHRRPRPHQPGPRPAEPAAKDAVAAASGTCDVEFDLESGARAGQRGRGVIEALRRAVPNAQAAGVVNNNAAALVLAATALAAGQEIIISRGELIEIGDRFRLPDLLESTGARLQRGRHHQPDQRRGLRSTPLAPPLASSSRCTPPTTGSRASPGQATLSRTRRAGRHARPRHRLRPARAAPAAARRAGRRHLPRATARTWSPPAATSSSAARRPGCCSVTSPWSAACCATRSPARCASTS